MATIRRFLLLLSMTCSLAAQTAGPDLRIAQSFPPMRLNPGQRGTVSPYVINYGTAPATNVRLTIETRGGGTIVAVESQSPETVCELAPPGAVCRVASLPHLFDGRSMSALVTVEAPRRSTGEPFVLHYEVTSDEPDLKPADNVLEYAVAVPRVLAVTSDADAGSGTLRQALLDAQALCASAACRIEFERAMIVRPLAPLPRMQGVLTLDGASRVELDGSVQSEGPGLVIGAGCELRVVNLTIRNFPGHGLEFRRPAGNCPSDSAVSPNTYVANSTFRGNLRGIYVESLGPLAIRQNVLERNRRSGIYVWDALFVAIEANRIEHNGNSGIYIDADADIRSNVITGHPEWGIARVGGDIDMRSNSIFGNGYLPIDYRLDFETPNAEDDRMRPPNAPRLLSAMYDAAANATVVRGEVTVRPLSRSYYPLQLELFASDGVGRFGFAEAQTSVLRAELAYGGAVREFTLSVPGDLTGKYISATNTRTYVTGLARSAPGPRRPSPHSHGVAVPGDTSELSNPVQVTR